MTEPDFNKVSIIGMGLMGGSLGQALIKYCPNITVTGVVRKQEAIPKVLELKAAHRCVCGIKEGVFDADLIVLSMPVEAICESASLIEPHIKHGCVVTDMGSTKKKILDALYSAVSLKGLFIGSHPIAGSEKTGVENAFPELFQGSTCIITPFDTETADSGYIDKLKRFWESVGCKIKTMTAESHDLLISAISHVPHLVASVMVNTAADVEYKGAKALDFAGPGFRDSTRIASGSPNMWQDICLSNKTNISSQLEKIESNLRVLREAVLSEDEGVIMSILNKAKETRDRLIIKSGDLNNA